MPLPCVFPAGSFRGQRPSPLSEINGDGLLETSHRDSAGLFKRLRGKKGVEEGEKACLISTPLESTSLVRVARTIPTHTYHFAPEDSIGGIAQLYANALSNVQRFVYLENQYFWTRAFSGIDRPLLGTDRPDMERNLHELAAALQRGATVAMMLPDHPNVGYTFTDAGLTHLLAGAPEAAAQGRIQTFCLAAAAEGEGAEVYLPIYVHAKVAIIDDLWSTVGSGNLNNRGMRYDTEMNVATLNEELARGLRMLLWAEHLELVGEEGMLTVARHLGHLYWLLETSVHKIVTRITIEHATTACGCR
jgi:phosphatidylserine/phosphatidylglycerophosphate/cardiolipin synthase-like enzyme